MFDKIGKIIGTVAPTVGSMIGGPIGGALGAGLSKILTGKENSSEDDLIKAYTNASAEQLEAIKKLELDAKVELERIKQQTYIAELGDKQNARKRQAAIIKSTGKHDQFMHFVGLLCTIGFLVMGIILAVYPMSQESKPVFNIFLGILGGGFSMVVSYYFGSSSSSARKTELMSK